MKRLLGLILSLFVFVSYGSAQMVLTNDVSLSTYGGSGDMVIFSFSGQAQSAFSDTHEFVYDFPAEVDVTTGVFSSGRTIITNGLGQTTARLAGPFLSGSSISLMVQGTIRQNYTPVRSLQGSRRFMNGLSSLSQQNDSVSVGYETLGLTKMYNVNGSNVTDTVTLTNNATFPVDVFLLNDVTSVNISTVDAGYSSTTGNMLGDIITLSPGQTIPYISLGTIAPFFSNDVTDFDFDRIDVATAAFSYNGDSLGLVSDDASITYDIDISFEKFVQREVTGLGDNVDFGFTIRNTGNAGLTGVALTDILPSGFTCISSGVIICNGNTVTIENLTIAPRPNNAPYSELFIEFKADRTSDQIITYTNTARLADVNNTTVATASVTSTTLGVARVGITKNTLTPNTAINFPGDRVEFEIVVTNTGTRAVTGLQITDVFDAQTMNYVSHNFVNYTDIDGNDGFLQNNIQPEWLGIDVGAGQTVRLRVIGEIISPKGQFVGENRTNTVELSNPGNNPGVIIGRASDTSQYIITPRREVSINKQYLGMVDDVDGQPYVGVQVYGSGDIARYRVTLTNTGNTAATGLIVRDTIFGQNNNLTFSSTDRVTNFTSGDMTRSDIDVAMDGTVSFIVEFELQNDIIQSCNNTAIVSGIPTNEILLGSSTTTDCTVQGMARLSLIKTHNNDVSPDRGLTPKGPSLPGDQTSFTLTIRNDGTRDATNIRLGDILPAGLSYVSSNITPTSSVPAIQREDLTIPAGGSIDVLLMTELVSQTGQYVGEMLTNDGIIRDPRVYLTGPTDHLLYLGLDLVDEVDDATVMVVPYMAGNITKTADANSLTNGVLSGDPVTYDVNFRNVGNTGMFFTIYDNRPQEYLTYNSSQSNVTLPNGFAARPGGQAGLDQITTLFGSVHVPTSFNGDLNNLGNQLRRHYGPADYLPVNAFGSISINATVAQDGFASFDNEVCLEYLGTSFFETNSSPDTIVVCDTETLNARSQLIYEKVRTSDNPNIAGDIVTFEIRVTNTGNTSRNGDLHIVDEFPANFAVPDSADYVKGGSFGNTVTRYRQNVTIAAGQSEIFSIQGELNSTGRNQGDVFINTADIRLGDSSSPVIATVIADGVIGTPRLSLTKTRLTANPYIPGDEVGFRLRIGNTSSEVARNVRITDIMPAILTDLVASTGNFVDQGNNTWRRDGAVIPAGGLDIIVTGSVATSQGRENSIDSIFTNTGIIQFGPDSDPLQETRTSTATGILMAGMGMEVTKTAIMTGAQLGDDIEFVINYRNTGNVELRFDVTDFWPQGIDFVSAVMTRQDGQSIAGGYNSNLDNSPNSPYSNNGEVQWSIREIGQTLQPGESGEVRIRGTISAGEFTCFDNTVLVKYGTANSSSPFFDSFENVTASDIICPRITLVPTKRLVGDLPERSGDTVTYEIIIENQGSTDATNAYIRDTMPPQILINNLVSAYFIDAVGVRRDIAPSAGAFNTELVRSGSAQVPTIPAQDTISLFIEATINDTVGVNQSFVNTVCVRPTPGDVNAERCDSSQDVVTLSDLSQMTFTKTSNISNVSSGSIVEFSLSLSVDPSVSQSYNVLLTDVLPMGMTFVENTSANFIVAETSPGVVNAAITNVQPGQTYTRTFTVRVTPSTYGFAPLLNTATADIRDITGSIGILTGEALLNPLSDTRITKRYIGPDVKEQGDVIEYEIVVENIGGSVATGVVVYDSFDLNYFIAASVNPLTIDGSPAILSGSIYNNALAYEILVGDIAPGSSRTIRLRGTLSQDGPVGQDILNTVIVQSSQDADVTNNTASVTHQIVGTPDLYIRKELTPGSFVQSGDQVQFIITYGNSGDRVASGRTLNDILSPQLRFIDASLLSSITNGQSVTFTGPVLLPNDQRTITYNTVINDNYNQGTIFQNIVHINGSGENVITNNSATVTGNTLGLADLSIRKNITSQPVLLSGDVVTYDIIVTNTGTATATGIIVRDLFPDALSFSSATPVAVASADTNYTYERALTGSLAPGESRTITLSGVLRGAYAINGTSFVNGAVVTTIAPERIITNNTATATDIVGGAGDVELIKTHVGELRRLDDEVTFTLNLTNTGVQAITGFVVTDVLPTGLSYVTGSANITPTTQTPLTRSSGAVLNPTQTVTYTFRARYSSLVTTPVITNTATVTTTSRELRPQNNTSSTDVVVVPISNIFVQKTLSPQTVGVQGDIVTFTLTFGNNGRASATGVRLTDVMPVGFTLASVDPWTSTFAGITDFSTNQTNQFNLPAGSGGVLTLRASLDTQPLVAGQYVNTATVSTISEESDLNDNSSSVTGSLSASLDVVVTKTAFPARQNGGASTIQGSTIDYVVDIRNAGTIPLTNVLVSDIRPNSQYLRFDGIVTGGVVQNASLNNILTTDLTVGQTRSVRLRGTVLNDQFVSLVNVARATTTVQGQQFVFSGSAIVTPPPAVCGDRILSSSEQCDISATGAILSRTPVYAGQVCNTSCEIETEFIVNTAQICYANTDICEEDDVHIDIDEKEPVLTLTKTANKKTDLTKDEEVIFTVVVKNEGPSIARNVTLTDVWPSTQLQYITGSINPNVAGDLANGRSLGDMTVGQQYILTLKGKILIENGTIVNTARITYTVNGQTRTQEATETIFVNTVASACASLGIQGSTTITATAAEIARGIDRGFTCTAVDPQTQTRYDVRCGNGQTFNTRTGVCEYTSFGTYNVSCRVDNSPVVSACEQTIIVKEADRLFCGDGKVGIAEQCDLGSGVGTAEGVTIGNYLDSDETVPSGNYKGAICRRCAIEDSPEPIVQPACSYSDTPISLQENEFLPFWRDVERDSNDAVSSVGSCSASNDGKVIEDTMTCSFSLIHKGDTLSNNDATFGTIELPCNQDMREDKQLFDYFLDGGLDDGINQFAYQTAQDAFGRYYIQLSNTLKPKTYGEYKLSLDKVSYKFCDNGRAVDGIPVARVCQSNFAVTRPYLMQEGAVSSTTNDRLDDFYTMQGEKINTSLSLDDVDTVNESYYDGGSDIDSLLSTFVNKYQKLAVTVPSTVPGMTADTIAKVPGRNIFVLTSNTNVSYEENIDLEGTTTIIIKGGDLIINGNISRNTMFIVPDGTIYFRPTDCNLRQVVNGVFIAGEPFDVLPDDARDGQLMNNQLDESRCNNGGLTVQGVLIGENIIDGLVNSKRSELNHWFTLRENIALTLENIRQERRDEIYNGAAVLIKHNNSLWKSLPPGADELRKSLDLYR